MPDGGRIAIVFASERLPGEMIKEFVMLRSMISASKITLAVVAIVLVISSGAEVLPDGDDLIAAPAEAMWWWIRWIPIPHFKEANTDADGLTICENRGISCIVWN